MQHSVRGSTGRAAHDDAINMLSTTNLAIQFDAKPLFEHVTVKFADGNRYGLIGANGAGKSTLMKMLGGEVEPSAGDITLQAGMRLGKLNQNQFAYEDERVLDVVMQGHAEMWRAMQINILINDMGMPLDRIIMDPTTGALGYGFEYGYSVMERLRLAALQGDSMTQMPMLVTPGEECWKAKESKVGEGVPKEWGDWLERAITWETLTSVMLVESGANIVVLRHPESVRRVRRAINDLAQAE